MFTLMLLGPGLAVRIGLRNRVSPGTRDAVFGAAVLTALAHAGYVSAPMQLLQLYFMLCAACAAEEITLVESLCVMPCACVFRWPPCMPKAAWKESLCHASGMMYTYDSSCMVSMHSVIPSACPGTEWCCAGDVW